VSCASHPSGPESIPCKIGESAGALALLTEDLAGVADRTSARGRHRPSATLLRGIEIWSRAARPTVSDAPASASRYRMGLRDAPSIETRTWRSPVSESKRTLLAAVKPPKPISQMTDEERADFARALYQKIKAALLAEEEERAN
jgi:hypothetical protein